MLFWSFRYNNIFIFFRNEIKIFGIFFIRVNSWQLEYYHSTDNNVCANAFLKLRLELLKKQSANKTW